MSAVGAPVVDPLRLSAEDVTGTKLLQLEGVDGHRLAGEVALALAQEMDLPTNTPWALRDDVNARMLIDEQSLGSQVDQDARVVVVPKSHLGAA
jgi:hypothetical protein